MAGCIHTCCFTGSRPEKMTFNYQKEPYQMEALRRDLRAAILRAADAGCTDFISGMSRGFDLWAAEEVLALRDTRPDLNLICAIPFSGQAHAWDEAWRALFSRLVHAVPPQNVRVLSPAYYRGCFHDRDRYMVDQASRVICWYTGAPGGTQYTYRYARRMGREIENLAASQLTFY